MMCDKDLYLLELNLCLAIFFFNMKSFYTPYYYILSQIISIFFGINLTIFLINIY